MDIQKLAWKVVNEVQKAIDDDVEHNYTADQIKKARIIAGEEKNPKIGWRQSWGPKKTIALNVIDRDSDINKTENHTSLLVKSEYDLGVTAGKRGIYEQIVKLLTRHRVELKDHFSKGHDWMPFDVILIKEGKGIDTSYDKERGKAEDLTQEELDMERYDLKSVCKPTDAAIVRKWLEKGAGTEKKKKAEATTVEKKAEPVKEEPKKETPKEEPKKEPVEETPKEEPKKKKSLKVKKEEPPKEEPKKVEVEEELDECPSCSKMIPVTSMKCPKCGCEFEGHDEEDSALPY